MELYSNEVEKLKTQLGNWLTHPQRELEATFGHTGTMDQTRFLAIAQRLKSKGYKEEDPKDYLTITIKEKENVKNDVNIRRDTLKNNTRFTVEGSENVRAYCEQESLEGLPYTVMLKTPLGNPAEDDLFLEDYDVKVKVRREIDRNLDDAVVQQLLSEDAWPKHQKVFRLIRRWSFFGPVKPSPGQNGYAYRFDLSMVRSNKKNPSGAYELTEMFRSENQDIMTNPSTFEVEVELLHDSFPVSPDTDIKEVTKRALSEFVKALGEILRGIQNNSILIRKSQKKKALDSYFNLVGVQQFRGVKPRTLEMKNFISKKIPNVPNIREGYNVTDKADGLRVLGFCDGEGELFMIDKALNVYRTGMKNSLCKNSLVDGEWITNIKDETDASITRATNQLWLFDIYIAPEGKVVDTFPFYVGGKQVPKDTSMRYNELQAWAKQWRTNGPTIASGIPASNKLIVQVKNFLFAEKGTGIFKQAEKMLALKTEYHTDGLIFTANNKPLPGPDTNFPEQFKWKPSEDNSIDFLVRIQKDPDTGKEVVLNQVFPDGKIVEYKTLVLKVGSTMNEACANPRQTILQEKPYPKGGCRSSKFMKDSRGKYKAVPFNPTDYSDPLASICRVEVKTDPDTQVEYIVTEKTNEPIRDYSIVEMRYDMSKPAGWRWIPMRIRVDKTEKLERGELTGTLNADFTADSIWNSIHNPITRSMISTGNEAPDESEIAGDDKEQLIDLSKAYFQRKANKQELQSVEGMRNFHKHYIKGDMLLTPTLKGGEKIVLDLAVGQAADINRWITNKVGFVYGIDIDATGITDSHRGAYTKYLNRLSENAGMFEDEQIKIPPMVFGIGDASKSLATGEAASNEEDANILRAIFGKVAPTPQPPVPPFVKNQATNKLKEGADVIPCMFALHYFFKSKATFQGLLNNIQQNLKVGGYFVACFFDGEKVFELLKKRNEGESVSGQFKNTTLWKITKEYSNPTLPTDDSGFGISILNNFISIGSEHREYLVPFDLLKKKMESIGCRLLSKEDLKSLGLPVSTETFDMSYERATVEAKKKGKEPFPMIQAVKDYSFLNRWCIFKRYGEDERQEEENVENVTAPSTVVPPTAAKKPQSLAWAEVSASSTGIPQNVVPTVVLKAREPGPEPDAGTSALTKGTPLNQKPINSLATTLAKAPVGVTVAAQLPEREFPPEKVFFFGVHEKNTDTLKDKEGKVIIPDATRRLGPAFPFTIVQNGVEYPSILHYVAAMEYERATNKPEQGEKLFSNTGTIHLEFIGKSERKKATASKAEVANIEQEIQAEEAKAILANGPLKTFKKYNLEYDEAKWIAERDGIWKAAYQQRYEKDKPFRDALTKLRELEKYLVYRATADNKLSLNGLGGAGRKKGKMTKIEGENKLGVLLMTIAGYPGYKIETAGSPEEKEEE